MSVNRRTFIKAGAAGASLALAGCATTPSRPLARVVVIGGGYGGATAAKYLRLWEPRLEVTLVERNEAFVSCPISNLVLGGHKQMADITRGYDGLKALGVKVMQGEVTAIDAAGKKVKLAGGTELSYDRLILSPGVDFITEGTPGLQAALDSVCESHGEAFVLCVFPGDTKLRGSNMLQSCRWRSAWHSPVSCATCVAAQAWCSQVGHRDSLLMTRGLAR